MEEILGSGDDEVDPPIFCAQLSRLSTSFLYSIFAGSGLAQGKRRDRSLAPLPLATGSMALFSGCSCARVSQATVVRRLVGVAIAGVYGDSLEVLGQKESDGAGAAEEECSRSEKIEQLEVQVCHGLYYGGTKENN